MLFIIVLLFSTLYFRLVSPYTRERKKFSRRKKFTAGVSMLYQITEICRKHFLVFPKHSFAGMFCQKKRRKASIKTTFSLGTVHEQLFLKFLTPSIHLKEPSASSPPPHSHLKSEKEKKILNSASNGKNILRGDANKFGEEFKFIPYLRSEIQHQAHEDG